MTFLALNRPDHCRRDAAPGRPRRRAGAPLLALLGASLFGACDGATAPEPTGPTGVAASAAPSAVRAIQTIFQFGDYAVYVPANVRRVRGVLLALGGPDTRGYAAGTTFRAPPIVEDSLQALGVMLRDLAAERGLAIVGTARFGPFAFPNSPASDALLLNAIAQGATASGHPELVDAPLIVYGSSGGGPEAVGFTQRNPARVAGLLLSAPSVAGPLSGAALAIPAFMFLSEQDVFVNNVALRATFETHRAAGAPWGMAVEPGAIHFSMSSARRELIVSWIRAIMQLDGAAPFSQNGPTVGWLADPVTGQIAPVAAFDGDPTKASWLPLRPLAEQWKAYIGL